ncbi:unnamed protein product [Mycena citricolor]|uniref:Uncharacterized protein n=1 Tax=Mycena citricolor TaxID=2018698 RepID=A0AAD2HV58_9AGAR|nr:unnamed protein product [Mycena citricolor]
MVRSNPNKSRKIQEREKSGQKKAGSGNKGKNKKSEDAWLADGDVGLHQIIEQVQENAKEDDKVDLDEETDENGDIFDSFKFDHKEAIAAIDLLRKITQTRPDQDVSMPLDANPKKLGLNLVQEKEESKVQVSLDSFFGPK